MNHGIKIQFNEINNIEYTKWMKSILRMIGDLMNVLSL